MRHLNFSGEEILETITMVRTEQLDIRTITIGISLLDCVSDSCEGLCRNVYEKVERVARDLRRVSAEISQEYGLPIINNRIAVTPVSLIAGRSSPQDLLRVAETLDRAAHDVNVDFIGGFSAHVEKGMTQSHGRHHQAHRQTDRRRKLDRLRQARRVLQRGRGQSVHGRSVSWRERA
jgi:uncharacterized protein (UPF0210 family)